LKIIIECNFCKAHVDAKIIAQHESFDESDPAPFLTSLLECPSCNNSLVAGQYVWRTGFGEDSVEEAPYRVWPQPKKHLSWTIPEGIRISIEEAQKCISGGAFIASAAISGRALEGVCRYFKYQEQISGWRVGRVEAKGQMIDKRLLEWGRELQKHRNIAAHASDEKINPQDAMDLMDFVIAICEYFLC